ncbi:hypothetical protein Tco_1260344 [Tanacetum coccineum]
MSSSSKSPRDYSRKYKKAILEPWRQNHNLPPSPPSPPPNRTLPTSPITINSLSSPSPPQNPTQNQIAHELLRLSNLLEINLHQAIDATNPSPPTSPCIPPPTLDQLNTAYPLPLDTAYPVLSPIQRIHLNRLIRLRMTKVIKGKFEKIKDVKVEDVSLTCDTQLEIFNIEVSRLSGMDNDLFTYEVKVANIPCHSIMNDDSEDETDDDMGYDPSDVAFIEWLGSKNFNYKTMDQYTMKALWIYWIRGDDEVELTDEESSDNEDEITEVFRIDTNIFDYETPICSAFNEFNYLLKVDPDLLTKDIIGFKTYEDYKDDWIYKWNKDVPWVDEKPWTDTEVWTEPKLVIHTCKPFNYKTGCSEWQTCSWKEDGYCNGGNLPGTYFIENQLHYQDYEWYEALEDSELKDEALRNKAIMEGFINKDDDESCYEKRDDITFILIMMMLMR